MVNFKLGKNAHGGYTTYGGLHCIGLRSAVVLTLISIFLISFRA